jgi:hypothetical protein
MDAPVSTYNSLSYRSAGKTTNLFNRSLDGSDGELLGISSAIIRSFQNLNIFFSKVFRKTSIKMAVGGVELESNSSCATVNPRKKHPDGRFTSGQLTFYHFTEGGFEFDSFRLRTAVSLRSGRVASSHHCPRRRHESSKHMTLISPKVNAPSYRALCLQNLTGQNHIAVRLSELQESLSHFDDKSRRSKQTVCRTVGTLAHRHPRH